MKISENTIATSMRNVVRAAYSGRWRGSSDGGCFCSSASGSNKWRLASPRKTSIPIISSSASTSQRLNSRAQPPTEIGTFTRMLDARLSQNGQKIHGLAPSRPRDRPTTNTDFMSFKPFCGATAICPKSPSIALSRGARSNTLPLSRRVFCSHPSYAVRHCQKRRRILDLRRMTPAVEGRIIITIGVAQDRRQIF